MNSDQNSGQFKQFKPQALAFSCASCAEAFDTIEELEQHELSCGDEDQAAQARELDEDE